MDCIGGTLGFWGSPVENTALPCINSFNEMGGNVQNVKLALYNGRVKQNITKQGVQTLSKFH